MRTKLSVKLIVCAMVILVAALALPGLAQAGGWVVITLDRLPESLTAGQAVPLGFMARQHGRTPWQVEEIQISARQPATGEQVSFTAKPEGKPGHYTAELVFPAAGLWEWGIAGGMFPDVQPMPALTVSAGAGAAAAETARPGTLSLTTASLGAAALLALAAGVVLLARGGAQRSRRLAGLGLLVGCGALVFALFTSATAEARQAAQPVPVTAVQSEVEMGRHLFLAKGCVVCHVNDRAIQGSSSFSVGMGPNLSAYHNDPAYLQSWLKDPAAVKNTAQMPDLGLSLVEINALVAFINED